MSRIDGAQDFRDTLDKLRRSILAGVDGYTKTAIKAEADMHANKGAAVAHSKLAEQVVPDIERLIAVADAMLKSHGEGEKRPRIAAEAVKPPSG